LIPQVRANLVYCNTDAATTSDVMGIPGRITTVGGVARALINPRFGASRHTAQLLLWVKTRWKKVRACICISGSDEILTSSESIGFQIIRLQKPSTDVEEIIANLKKESTGSTTKSLIGVHVPGGIGIEPILYLFDDSVQKLVEKTIVLSDTL
jgi:predicted fused transcriptional regulator/phosphomethylpyrimidine kinase